MLKQKLIIASVLFLNFMTAVLTKFRTIPNFSLLMDFWIQVTSNIILSIANNNTKEKYLLQIENLQIFPVFS